MPTYPSGVATVHEKYNVPAVLGTINLNRRIEEGDELDPVNLEHAKLTATALRSMLKVGNYAELNEDVVRGAELRAKAVENIHAAIEYTPANLFEALQNINQNIDGLRNEVRVGRAETHNALTRMSNRFISPNALAPVQKAVSGNGIVRARALAIPNMDPNVRQAFEDYGAENPAPAIGSMPEFFNGNIDSLQHVTILKLICFYNGDMGINQGDSLAMRKQSVRNYLTRI